MSKQVRIVKVERVQTAGDVKIEVSKLGFVATSNVAVEGSFVSAEGQSKDEASTAARRAALMALADGAQIVD